MAFFSILNYWIIVFQQNFGMWEKPTVFACSENAHVVQLYAYSVQFIINEQLQSIHVHMEPFWWGASKTSRDKTVMSCTCPRKLLEELERMFETHLILLHWEEYDAKLIPYMIEKEAEWHFKWYLKSVITAFLRFVLAVTLLEDLGYR